MVRWPLVVHEVPEVGDGWPSRPSESIQVRFSAHESVSSCKKQWTGGVSRWEVKNQSPWLWVSSCVLAQPRLWWRTPCSLWGTGGVGRGVGRSSMYLPSLTLCSSLLSADVACAVGSYGSYSSIKYNLKSFYLFFTKWHPNHQMFCVCDLHSFWCFRMHFISVMTFLDMLPLVCDYKCMWLVSPAWFLGNIVNFTLNLYIKSQWP